VLVSSIVVPLVLEYELVEVVEGEYEVVEGEFEEVEGEYEEVEVVVE